MREAGIGYAFDGPFQARGCDHGPDGGCGHTLWMADVLPAYRKDKQTWRKIPGADAWIGWEQLPGPGELARGKQLEGHVVELADGNRWLVPVARQEEGGLRGKIALPQVLSIDDETGEWVMGGVDPHYRELWDVAVNYWDTLMAAAREEGDSVVFTVANAADGAVVALGANYRLGRYEASLLGLLNDDTVIDVLRALVDWPTVEAWMKKKAKEESQQEPTAAASDTASGEAA